MTAAEISSASEAGAAAARLARLRRWASRRVNILFVMPTVHHRLRLRLRLRLLVGGCSPSPTRRPSRSFNFVGLQQYVSLWSNSRWHASVTNLVIFTVGFVGLSTLVGLLLAILLDQRVKAEGFFRTIYLYPLAISFIVTGTAWKWALNPGLGIEKLMHDWGFASFQFDWIANPDRAIYTLIIAAVWQGSGFAMAVFLAALRGVDAEIVKAAKIDGAGPVRTYCSVVMPLLRPAFLTVFIIMVALAHPHLRPDGGDDRRRTGLRDRPADQFHVPVRLRPAAARPRRGELDHDLRRRSPRS